MLIITFLNNKYFANIQSHHTYFIFPKLIRKICFYNNNKSYIN